MAQNDDRAALQRLNRDARDEDRGTPVAYQTEAGVSKAWEGNDDVPFVGMPAEGMDPQEYLPVTTLSMGSITDGALIDTVGWRLLTFDIIYTAGGVSGQAAIIPQKLVQRGGDVTQNVWGNIIVLDGAIAVVTPPALAAVYGRRLMYPSIFYTQAAPAPADVVSGALTLDVSTYSAVRLRHYEVTAAAGTLQIFYALAR